MTLPNSHTILNVDDDNAGRYAKSRIMQRAGYRVLEADTGAAALQLVGEGKPALVLLDIKLPDIDGIEVCRAIKNNPASSHVMVLQISAIKVNSADRIRGLEGGADGYLSEPIEAEELVATSRALLRLFDRERENRRLLTALAESEAQSRAFFESTSVGLCQADARTEGLLSVNRCFCQMVGYSEEELLGRSLGEIIHAEDRAHHRHDFSAISRDEASGYHVETRFVRKDGALVYADVTVNLVRSADGQPLRTIAVVHDISERKEAEAARRESEERLRLVAQAARFGTYDVEAGREEIYCSPELRAICDLSSGEPLSLEKALALIHPEDRAVVLGSIAGALESGGVGEYEAEFRIVRTNGEVRWVILRGRGYFSEDGGHPLPVRGLGTVTDITARKRAEEQLRLQNDRLQLLAQTAERLLVAADPGSMMREVFATVQQHFGLDGYLSYGVDESVNALVLEASAGIDAEIAPTFERLTFGESLCGMVAETRAPVLVERLQDCLDPKAQLAKQAGFRAYVCHPLLVGDRLLGTLSFGSKHRNSFEPDEIESMRTICHYVAIAKERQRLLDESHRHAGRLAKSELRLQLALDTANVGIYEWQLRTVQAVWDDRLRAHWGVRTGTPLTYDMFMGGIHPEDRAAAQAAMEPALDPTGSGKFDIEFRVTGHDDGVERWIASHGQVFYDNGRPALLLGTTFDLTEHKRVELELISLRDRLALELAEMTRLHELSTALLVDNDLETMLHRVLEASMQLLGARQGTLQLYDETRQRLTIVAHSGFDQVFLDHFAEVGPDTSSSCGMALKLCERVMIDDLAHSELADTAEFFASYGVSAVQSTPIHSAGGKILGVLSTHFAEPHRPFEREMRLLDLYAQQAGRVIERRQAEDALRKSEERLTLALEASRSGVWDLDLISGAAAVSPSFRELHGFSADEFIVTRKWLRRVNRQDRRRLARYLQDLSDGDPEFDFEYRIDHPHRGERWLAAVGRVVRDADGRAARLIGVDMDITERKRFETARAQLAAIVETSEDAIIGADLSENITSWNRGAERLYGFSAAEMLGQPVSLLIPSDREQEELAVLRRVLHGESIENYETRRRRKHGGAIDVALTISPLKNERGEVVGASKIARDISARIVAEESLWRSEEQLRLAQSAAHVGIWDWDPESNRLSWSSEMTNLYGVSQPVQSYSQWRELVHVDDLARVEKEREEAIGAGRFFNIDYRILHGSGEQRWISSRGQGRYGDEGKLTRVLGINMDITERKRAEAKQRESERRFRALADSAPVLIWINGPEGAQFCNQAYREFVGVSDDSELVGSGWENYLHPNDRDSYVAAYAQAMRERYRFEADVRFRRADGQYRWMKSLAMPRFTEEGGFLGYAGCTIDIHDSKLAEAQLALLAALVNSSQDAIYSFTLDTRIVSWNRAAEALYGWSEAEVLGQSWRLFVPPELLGELDEIIEQVRGGELVTRFETQRARKDGSRFDVSLTFSPVVAQNKIVAISAIARDITERKRAEEQRAQQARLLDLSLDAIVVWNSPAGIIEYWNEGAEKLYGFSAGEVVGRSISDTLKPIFPISAAEIQKKIQLEGEWDGRLVHTQKSGGRVAVLSRMQRIARPGGDAVLEVNRDITIVEEAERAVAEAGAHVKAIVETAIDGIITIDERGFVESLNPAAERIFGYAANDVIGKRVASLMPELEIDFGAESSNEYPKDTGRTVVASGTETRGRRSDGSEFSADIGVSETVIGETHFYTALVRDATARKEAERSLVEAKNAADAANRAKSEFLANMSHEIRNPMTGIMGYADILLERLQDRGAIECVRTIKDSGHYLLQIINDLLDLAKIEAQGLQLEKEEIHLPTFITDIYTLMEGAARAKGLPLALRYDGVIPYEIESDPKRVRQILINLLGNAIKFTDRGGVELGVHFDGHKNELQFYVSDSGIGMTSEQQQNLFKPFTQGDSSMTKNYGGTGLGLAITKRLVEALDGRISVDSTPDRGSTFHVSLPVRLLSGGAYRDIEMSPNSPAPSLPKSLDVRVMIVEDQPDIRRLMEYFIGAAGGIVTTFNSGESALAALEQQPNDFDVILMDIQMPRVDGYETTRRIRALGCNKPIIAVTAAAMAGDQANCIAAGCSDYISKPIDMAMLLQRIARVAATRQTIARQEHLREPGLWDAAQINGTSAPESDAIDTEGRRVLVIDDRAVALNATKSLLEMYGFDVRTAATGHAALRIAPGFRPHYVFVDISLPDISGYEVFRRLKEHEQLAHSKFIALSGHGREESLRARKAGFDAYMTKPVDINEMKKLMSGEA